MRWLDPVFEGGAPDSSRVVYMSGVAHRIQGVPKKRKTPATIIIIFAKYFVYVKKFRLSDLEGGGVLC